MLNQLDAQAGRVVNEFTGCAQCVVTLCPSETVEQLLSTLVKNTGEG